MTSSVPSCESFETVMLRVAAEIGAAANELASVENRVAAIVASSPACATELGQLQALDRIGQQLRTLEAFLESAFSCRCGRIDLARALDEVWLEGVRARLGGGIAPIAVGGEVDVW